MTADSVRHCYLKCLVDTIHPLWVTECDWLNRFTGSCQSSVSNDIQTYVYLSNDGRRLLYATNYILACEENSGFPWAGKHGSKTGLLPENETKRKFLYPGLFVSEYTHPNRLTTLNEYMMKKPFSSVIFVKHIQSIIDIISFHMFPYCLSEDLLLVDEIDDRLLCCSCNYILSFSHPIPDKLFKLFSGRFHPHVVAERHKNPTYVDNIIPPSKMKIYCAKMIQKEAHNDIIAYICNLVYFLGSIATYWRLGMKWPSNEHIKKSAKKNNKCHMFCNLSKSSNASDIENKIHSFMCIEVMRNLPKTIRGNNLHPVYISYKRVLGELKSYIIGLDYE